MLRILICMETLAAGGLGTYTRSLITQYLLSGWEVGLAVTHGPGEYYEEIKESVTSSLDVSTTRNIYVKLKKLTEYTVKFKPDILLLNNCSLAHYMLPFLDSSVKPVAVLHSNGALIYRAASLFSKRIFRWIAPSQALKDSFSDYIPVDSAHKIRVISHGVDSSKFAYKEKHAVPRRVVTAGFVAYNKGIDLLPEIYSKIYALHKNVEFYVVGDGPLAAFIQEEAKKLQLPVTFTGHISPEKMPEIFADSDILLLPTRVEGFGLVIVEAMMSGVVPVVSLLEGVTDKIVADCKSGILVKVDDSDGFAEAVLSLFNDSNSFKSMSEAAREDSTDKFAMNSMINSYTALFMEADDRNVKPVSSLILYGLEIMETLLRKEPDGSIPLLRCLINFTIRLRNRFAGR